MRSLGRLAAVLTAACCLSVPAGAEGAAGSVSGSPAAGSIVRAHYKSIPGGFVVPFHYTTTATCPDYVLGTYRARGRLEVAVDYYRGVGVGERGGLNQDGNSVSGVYEKFALSSVPSMRGVQQGFAVTVQCFGIGQSYLETVRFPIGVVDAVAAPRRAPARRAHRGAAPGPTRRQLRNVTSALYRSAKTANRLGPRARRAFAAYRQAPRARARSFAEVLQDIEDFFEQKDKGLELWETLKREHKRFADKYPSSAAQAGVDLKTAQLKALPDFAKALEKLGDYRNVAIRAADRWSGTSEGRSQLDALSELAYSKQWSALSVTEKGNLAVSFDVSRQSGAAKRLVNEMVEAAKSGANIVYAH